MTPARKLLLLALGFLSAFLVVSQLILGQLLVAGRTNLVKAHQHTGYTTVAVASVYILLSLWTVLNVETRRKPGA